MSHILICGAAGYTNLGDDALLWGMLTDLRRVTGSRPIRVVGGPDLQSLTSAFEAVALSYDDRSELARSIEDADLVILGGGGLLYDVDYDASLTRFLTDPPDRQWLYELAKIAAAARAAGRPVMVYGVGAGPLTTESARKAARFVGEQARIVTVRDAASADLLAECGLSRSRVYVSADPALSVDPGSAESAQAFLDQVGIASRPRPWVALNIRPWYRFAGVEAGATGARERLISRTGELVRLLVERLHATVALLPMQRSPDDDRQVLEQIRRAAGDPTAAVLVGPAFSPPEIVAALSRFDLLVGMRLHSLILALDAGIPFVGLSYSPKVAVFAASAGMSGYLHSIDDFEPGDVVASCERALSERSSLTAALAERRRHLRESARIPAELAASILENRKPSVRAPAAALSVKRPAKGLRVLMQIRPDYRALPGGDVVQLEEMLPYFAEAGVVADMTGEAQPDLSGYDLVHTINLDRPEEPYQHCLNALEQGKPIALSTVHTDLSEFLAWGDPDYWELPDPAEGLPRARPAPQPHPVEMRRRALQHLQRQATIDWSDSYLPNAHVNAEFLHGAFGMDLSRTVVVPNAARERFLDASPGLFASKYGMRDFVLCVGRIEAKKNQLSLIAAMRGTGIPLVVVGRSNPESYLDLCRRYADRNVTFIESLPEDELASAYAAAKVHALTSWVELPGLTTLEAAAAGCNIVSTDRGSPPEYLQDMAWYCDPSNIESIRQAVVEAYGAPRSDRLKEHIRSTYTWRRAAEQTIEGYRVALAVHEQKSSAQREAELLAAARRHADWVTRLAEDRRYQAERLALRCQELEGWGQGLEKLLAQQRDELRQITSRRLYRWSVALARTGWGILHALGFKR